VAYQRGDHSKAVGLLSQAIESFDLADIDLYEAVARRRLGELLGNERGRRHIDEADAWMRKKQIKNPEAMTRMMAPGF
jgi:eukaryotic-like serine/threonine-protein kinase